jgi:hypothetical protein
MTIKQGWLDTNGVFHENVVPKYGPMMGVHMIGKEENLPRPTGPCASCLDCECLLPSKIGCRHHDAVWEKRRMEAERLNVPAENVNHVPARYFGEIKSKGTPGRPGGGVGYDISGIKMPDTPPEWCPRNKAEAVPQAAAAPAPMIVEIAGVRYMIVNGEAYKLA